MPNDILVLKALDVERVLSSISASDLFSLVTTVLHRFVEHTFVPPFASTSTSPLAGSSTPAFSMPHRISVLISGHTALCMPARPAPFGTAIKVVSFPTSSSDTRGYPSIPVVRISNRSLNARATSLLCSLAVSFPDVQFSLARPGSSLRTEIEQADVIVCATSAREPLMGGEEKFVKDGAHVILVGSFTPDMHEVSAELLRRTTRTGGVRVVVDSRSACLAEAGEFIETGATAEDLIEVGELVRLKEDGGWEADEEKCREIRSGGAITVWKSVGVGVQDVAIAEYVVRKATELGTGVRVEGYDV
jgi:hypothetical protein